MSGPRTTLPAFAGGNTQTLDAIRDALAECLWDEEPWLTDDLTELIERVYVMAGGNTSEPPAAGASGKSGA